MSYQWERRTWNEHVRSIRRETVQTHVQGEKVSNIELGPLLRDEEVRSLLRAAVWERVKDVRGLLYEKEPLDLIDAALMAAPGPRIEIGCLAGYSTCCIACATSDLDQVLSIDLFDIAAVEGWRGWVEQLVGPCFSTMQDFQWLWEQQVRQCCPEKRCIPIKGDHVEVLPRVLEVLDGAKATFLFLDGPHDRVSVDLELELYLPLLTPDAIVAFHDYGKDWPGVMGAVDAALADGRLTTVREGYLFIARRRA